MLLFVGTYTRHTQSEGIYAFNVAEDFSSAKLLATNTNIDNPSYLIKHPVLDVIYCVNETSDYLDTESGAVSAFKFNQTGQLTLLNQQSSLGADPCHLTVSRDGNFLLVSNYTGGSFTSYPLLPDGSFGDFVSAVQHQGKSVIESRQSQAHVHSTILDKQRSMVIVADLGADQLAQYPIDRTGQVAVHQRKTTKVEAGAGPRLLAAYKDYYFLINELNNTITSYVFTDADRLEDCHTCSSLNPKNEAVESYAAHVSISQTGDSAQLYASNRGDDSIGVFSVQENGQLVAEQFVSTQGKHPRHFTLSSDESHLLVANKDSDNIVVFARDMLTGEVGFNGLELSCPSPTYLLLC